MKTREEKNLLKLRGDKSSSNNRHTAASDEIVPGHGLASAEKPDDQLVHLNTRVPNFFRKTVKNTAHTTGFDLEQIAIDAWRFYLELGVTLVSVKGDDQLMFRRKLVLNALKSVATKADRDKLMKMVRDRGFEPLTPTVSMLRSARRLVFRLEGKASEQPSDITQSV